MQRITNGEGILPPDDEFAYSTPAEFSTFASPYRLPQMLDYGPLGLYPSPLVGGDATYIMPVLHSYVSQQHLVGSPLWFSTPSQQPVPHTRIPVSPVGPSVIPSSRTQRKKITADDRRNICLYHEENKLAKHTDIGALFGVKRSFSTVSKILSQKDKHCKLIEEQSPMTGPKGLVPDIEKCAMIEQSPSAVGPPLEVNKGPCITTKRIGPSSGIKRNLNGSDSKVQSRALAPKSKVPESPTKDEARRALGRVIRYLELHPSVAADEYGIINGIMKHLQ